jgi:gliding motility-associated-like protein
VAEGRGACNPARDTMNIEIIPAPSADAGPEKIVCEKTPVTDIIATVKNADSIIWTSGNGKFAPHKNSHKINYTLSADEIQNGYAKLILKSMKTLCKPASDTVIVRSVRHPDLQSADVESCIGSKVTIRTTAHQAVTYRWRNNTGFIVGSAPYAEVLITQDTTKYFVDATSQNNCSSADSLIVTGIPYAEFTLGDVNFCPGEAGEMDIKLLNTEKLKKYPLIYRWKKENTVLPGTASQITVTEPGTYTGFIKVKELCESSVSASAELRPLPVSSLKDLYKFCSESEQNIVLDAGEASHYEWEPGEDTLRIKNTNTSGHFSVILTNSYGCKKRFETLVKEVCPPRLFVSRAFSPNQDGSNDLYDVFGAHIGAFQLLIFNRWGEIIYETNDRFKFWDGMYRGEPMPVGVYPWIITYEGDSEEFRGPYKLEGSVTVIR